MKIEILLLKRHQQLQHRNKFEEEKIILCEVFCKTTFFRNKKCIFYAKS